ncbi:hypothetical protein [Micromonospora peucetia]|uniref:hypothetical protein n=1 Tax=Micromonospora peucetia TaxID=47871 RepID=UPI003EBA6D76
MWHHVEQYANNPIEADHSQRKHRSRPMRGLRTDKTAQTPLADPAPATLPDLAAIRRALPQVGHFSTAAGRSGRPSLGPSLAE